MKRALLLLSLLFAAPALAATDPPAAGQPYQQFRSTDRYKHIAVIRPSRWDALSAASLQAIRQNMLNNMGNVLEQAEMNGLEVHYYDSGFFESDKDHREMWTDLGNKYALAIVLWPQAFTGGGAGNIRYVNADSTNVQILCIGGNDNNTGWAPDSSARGFYDTFTTGRETRSDNNSAGLVTYDGVDTLWGNFIASGRRKLADDANITRVVRLLKPFIAGFGIGFVWHADSVNAYVPTSGDSVAAYAEYLGPMWRTDYANYSGQGNTAWINSLASGARGASEGGASPKSVYWVKVPSGNVTGRGYQHLIWALVCRFTKAKPIKWAYDWDDVTDKFTNSQGEPPRWRSTAAESSIKALAAFGIKPTTMVNPEHAAAYINGTNPSKETAWSGGGHEYLKNMTWVHHSHDSTVSNISSNLVGGFGGYGLGNGSNITQGGVSIQFYGHRYASRWNPGANEARYIGAGGNFGILQRLQYSDSVRAAVAPFTRKPPYLAFPANEMLPVGWRPRPTFFDTLWTTNNTAVKKQTPCGSSGTATITNVDGFGRVEVGMSVLTDSTLGIAPGSTVRSITGTTLTLNGPTGDTLIKTGTGSGRPTFYFPECPIDSTFWAYDYALVGGDGSDHARKLFLRIVTDNPLGYYATTPFRTPLGTTTQFDRDSVVAASPFLYPNEQYTVPVGGRLVQAVGVGSFLQGNSIRSQYQASGAYRTSVVLGLRNPVQRTEIYNLATGESFSYDVNSVLATGGGGITGLRDFTARQANRVVYQHPGQNGDTPAQTGDYHVDVFVLSMATQMRIMDKLAGRRTQLCVPAWTVYAK